MTSSRPSSESESEMTPKEMVAFAFRELQAECALQQKVIWTQTAIILILSGLTFAQFKGIPP